MVNEMEECIFCKISNKEIGSLIFEDEYVVAFDDLNPQAPVHVLVVPKKHIENLEALEEKHLIYISKIHEAVKKIAEEKGISKTGYRIINNCGKDAGQSVMHLHYHLLGGKSLGEKII